MVEVGVKAWRFVKGLCTVESFGFFKSARQSSVFKARGADESQNVTVLPFYQKPS